ncbi:MULTISPECIES: TonB-dependent receptor plug domain-containing protein [unclassified Sphingopyxis]|mgnify:CR=1 FL=1|nr:MULTISPECIES: TonB-dependent receptor plug domain-containing protein [unclassified Sphingopyxis]AVA13035.1 ABC transporter ATP-binding protein [Sphingopyxis sp. MG]ODU30439.1 MAG: ABC transporter ATP-binding protein [Sphingopyxis sp. SCN 67-31]
MKSPSLSLRSALLAATALAATPALAVDDQPVDTVSVQSDSDFGDDYEDEIVVTAPRLAGQLDTDFAAEVELDEADIASYGASSIAELLDALEPQTRSGRGRGGGRPVILVNGRRISGFGAVRNIPPEAIAKVEVFPEQVALQYGYAATERVVNFVLKSDFRQISAEAEAGIPTQGGQFKSELEPAFMAIGNNGRLNLNASWEHQTMLRESDRDLIPVTGSAADAEARSLSPASDTYVIDGTLVRGIDKVTEASVSLRFDQTDSLSLLGPGAGGAGDPLRRDSRTQNWTSSASVNGMLGDWRWSATGNYSDADQRIFTDRLGGTSDRFDSSQQSFGGNANISGSVIDGWAGPIRASITGSYTGLRFDSRSERGGTITVTDLARDTPSVFGSLTVPLLDPDYEVGKLGRLSLTLNAEVERPSDFSALKSWGATLNWGLTGNLSLLASFASDEAAPSMTQLGAAPLVTPAVTYYDFATGQTVQITTTTGGNPFLLAEQRRDLKLGLNWNVPMVDGLRFSIDYNRNRSLDTANSFPLLTPEIEAAFPGRVVRDGSGTLIALDQRPVNFDRATNSQIRWGINYGASFGQKEATASEGAGGRAGGRRGAEGADAPPPPDGSAAPRGEGGPPPSAGGRGFGRPGGGARGPGGMFGGRPQGGRWNISLYHTVKLTDKVLIGPGVPELDLLGGSATGNGGGSNRHLLELDGGVFYKGFGARVSAKYDSGSTIVGGANGNLDFHDLATFNLRVFADFNQMPKLTGSLPFLKNSRVRLSVDNLFDAQRRITDASGVVPLNYQPGYIDPLGRYIELQWRKAF